MTSAHATVLTGALLLGFQQGGQPWQRHGPTEAEKEASRIKIGMTKTQQAQIETVFKESGKREQDIRKKMRELYGELFAKLYHNYNYDRSREEAIQKEIVELYKQRVKIQTHTQTQLRKILNRDQFDRMIAQMDEQREKMKKMWEQRGRMGRPGGPPGGGGPGGGPGGLQRGGFRQPVRPGGI